MHIHGGRLARVPHCLVTVFQSGGGGSAIAPGPQAWSPLPAQQSVLARPAWTSRALLLGPSACDLSLGSPATPSLHPGPWTLL